jgi:hypothetical protein
MCPIGSARPGIQIEAAGLAQHVGGRRLVGDEAGHVDIGIGVGEVDAGGVAMARHRYVLEEVNVRS